MRVYDAVFFDVDGTLIDSAPGILHSMRETFSRMGVDITDVNLWQYLGPPLRWTFSQHFDQEEKIEQAVSCYRACYKEFGADESELFAGAREMLETLHHAGIPLYTATSKPTEVVIPMLRRLGIYDCFDAIGGASMGTDRDTKAAVIRWLLSRPELAGKKVLMVGDRAQDMIGAKECGLDAAAVLYGYGDRAELSPYTPRILADTPEHLTSYILKGE